MNHYRMVLVLTRLLALSVVNNVVYGFSSVGRPSGSSIRNNVFHLGMSSSGSSKTVQMNKKVIVIISPSGGIGEITATTLAREGSTVRWFVVDNDNSNKFYLPKETWDVIKQNEGELDISGGDALSILLPQSNPDSLADNVMQWCKGTTTVHAIISCFDTTAASGDSSTSDDYNNDEVLYKAVKCVTQMACSKLPSSVKRIEVAPVPLSVEEGSAPQKKQKGASVTDWLSKTLSGEKDVPSTLREAMTSSSSAPDDIVNLLTIRHCNLFGTPESNIDSTPFIGGPRRDPIIRDENLFRSVQLSKTRRLKEKESDQIRTSRLSMGDAINQLLTFSSSSNAVVLPKDITLSSLRGFESLSTEEWNTQFQRLASVSRGTSNNGVATIAEDEQVVFEADFLSVPSVPKLADWLAIKWAPAVLGSYDIAGIRVGARPVYAARIIASTTTTKEESLEIVWQELINFEETVNVGKMIIRVTDKGIIATRKLLSTADGSTKLSATKPFPGELVLVRRLADAAGQAADKGLAVKRKVEKPKPAVASLSPPIVVQTPPLDFSAGPRSVGAKRSSQRSSRKISPEGTTDDSSATSSATKEG